MLFFLRDLLSVRTGEKTYAAPAGVSLIVASCTVTAFFLALLVLTSLDASSVLVSSALPVAILVGAALFSIRGYSIVDRTLLIHRLLWATRLPLDELGDARFAPGIMHGSTRVFGNGGLFSFSGWYRNDELGTYRAFVTDPAHTVVLWFRTYTAVVSPESPTEFVRNLFHSA